MDKVESSSDTTSECRIEANRLPARADLRSVLASAAEEELVYVQRSDAHRDGVLGTLAAPHLHESQVVSASEAQRHTDRHRNLNQTSEVQHAGHGFDNARPVVLVRNVSHNASATRRPRPDHPVSDGPESSRQRRCSAPSALSADSASDDRLEPLPSPNASLIHQHRSPFSPSSLPANNDSKPINRWPVSSSNRSSRRDRMDQSRANASPSSSGHICSAKNDGDESSQTSRDDTFDMTSCQSSLDVIHRRSGEGHQRGPREDSNGSTPKPHIQRMASAPVAVDRDRDGHSGGLPGGNRQVRDSSCWEILSKQHGSSSNVEAMVGRNASLSERSSLHNHFALATATVPSGLDPQHQTAPSQPQPKRQGGSGEGKWTTISDNQASVQLFYRLRNCRQTVDFARRQRSAFSRFDKALLTIPQAFEQLDSLREYESALMNNSSGTSDSLSSPPMSMADHARQTAEACRVRYPGLAWLELAGLLHSLGKLLAHRSFGSQAQWAVCGESFPLGCAFSSELTFSEAFCNNPDRRRRMYSSRLGMYQKGCGLRNVEMSWGCGEYLHMVLMRNKGEHAMPPSTLWLIRFHSFRSLIGPSPAYDYLLDDFDRSMLPWLRIFQELSSFEHLTLPGRMNGVQLQHHHEQLLSKFVPAGTLEW